MSDLWEKDYQKYESMVHTYNQKEKIYIKNTQRNWYENEVLFIVFVQKKKEIKMKRVIQDL
jgi:hypothetical protein